MEGVTDLPARVSGAPCPVYFVNPVKTAFFLCVFAIPQVELRMPVMLKSKNFWLDQMPMLKSRPASYLILLLGIDSQRIPF